MKKVIPIFGIIMAFLIQGYAQVSEKTISYLLDGNAIKDGHVGVSIYDVAAKKYLYNYNAEKYFTPSSNQKIFTLYAGLHYLGDSLVTATVYNTADYCFVVPNGDPTFLNNEFDRQPLLEILKKTSKPIIICTENWQETALGNGWMWDDYMDEFSAERSAMPVFGNVATIGGSRNYPKVQPSYFTNSVEWNANRENFVVSKNSHRDLNSNTFYTNSETIGSRSFPFLTDHGKTSVAILKAELQKDVQLNTVPLPKNIIADSIIVVKSVPVTDLFKPMMHRSDNFFAEQTLLMASNIALGKMNDRAIINDLLEHSLKGIPQEPQWVDGCGLSRYNLCTPQSIVFVLDKLQDEFGVEKMKEILPTGGEGTISNYYQEIRGNIFAKTGTMSDNSAFSGYLISKQNKLLLFSVMANNYQKGGRAIRLAIEKFLLGVWREN